MEMATHAALTASYALVDLLGALEGHRGKLCGVAHEE